MATLGGFHADRALAPLTSVSRVVTAVFSDAVTLLYVVPSGMLSIDEISV